VLLTTALDEYGLLLRRRTTAAEGQPAAAGLAALREFLIDFSGYESAGQVTTADLFLFLLDYYPAEEEPDPAVAAALLEVTANFARWLLEREFRGPAEFLVAEPRLREDLPRVALAFQALRAHARRDDLAPPLELLNEEQADAVASVTSGVHRLARLDQVDYPASEEDRFLVTRVEPDALTLTSPGREALAEGPLGPVPLPEGIAEHLRAGDTIHAELAPGTDGWEVLDVFSVRPVGYPGPQP
jgi:hypothetical protein